MDAQGTWVDALLVALVLLAAWGGWRRGLAWALLELLTLATGLLAALRWWPPLAAWLAPHLGEAWARPAAFVALFLLVRIGLSLLLGRALRRLPARFHAHAASRAAALLPGGANGLLDALLAVMLLTALPLPDGAASAVRDSRLATALMPAVERVEATLSPVFDEAAGTLMRRLVVDPGDGEQARVALPWSVRDAPPRPELEARMLELVNAERTRRGLRALRADPELVPVARAHADDMFERRYFSHVTPEGTDPFARMRRGGVRFVVAGENLALAPTLELAHRGLMDSPGHRANILRPQFGRLGVGILDGGRRGVMVVQLFRN